MPRKTRWCASDSGQGSSGQKLQGERKWDCSCPRAQRCRPHSHRRGGLWLVPCLSHAKAEMTAQRQSGRNPGHLSSQTVLFLSRREISSCLPPASRKVPSALDRRPVGSSPSLSAGLPRRERSEVAQSMQRAARRGLGNCWRLPRRRQTALAAQPVPSALSRGQPWLSGAKETEERDVPIQPASSLPSLGAAGSERGNDYLSGSWSGNWTHSTKTRKHHANWV